jgi:hypothetical protein
VKHLIRFNESVDIYQVDWHNIAPNELTLINDDRKIEFEIGNIMKHFDMIQVTYDTKGGGIWGVPDTLEFDLYFVKPGGKLNKDIRVNVDITYGNLVASEFSITSPNIVNVIQYTSYHSKFDPSNTVFAFDEESLHKIVDFFNKINSINVQRDQFNFLDKDPNSYYPK